MNRLYKIVAVMLFCTPLWVDASERADDKRLHLGVRLGASDVGEMTDAPWGVYADRIGFGATLSFDVSYHISKNLYLHSGVGLDYRYFASEHQEMSLECAGGRKSEFYIPKEHRQDKCHDDRFFGAGVSIGLGHTFSFGLFIDARLSYQLTDVVSVDKTCGSYTVSWGGSRIDNESGKETVEKEEYIDESIVGSYYLFHKIQLGIGYWF